MAKPNDPITAITRAYRRKWGIALAVIRAERANSPLHAQAISEALRWGEPAVQQGTNELLAWAIPLMHNATVVGGLVAEVSEGWLFPKRSNRPRIDVRHACADLRRLAEQHNVTNAAYLQIQRDESLRERTRAEAIHAYKASPQADLSALFHMDEPALVTAIRKGDRGQAREIINKLLVTMLQRAGNRLELTKSFFMELVVTIGRCAVEAGGRPEELLGADYESLVKLSSIDDDAELAQWLHDTLERVMDALHRAPHDPSKAAMRMAIKLMQEQCCDELSRNDVADAVGMSAAHFSRSFARHFGRPFQDVLLDLRTNRAAELLASSPTPIKLIAMRCGFSDQAHLTRAFRRTYRTTPAQYRREHQNTKESSSASGRA